MANRLSTDSPLKNGAYKKSTSYFFEASKLFDAQTTELFDQIWPIVTALKNLRWQVRGYYSECDVSQNIALSAKFVEKEDKTNRPNLYRVCVAQSWDEQEAFVTKTLLVNLFANYEAWCDNVLDVIKCKGKEKKLQYPGIKAYIESIQTAPNAILVDAFYDVYVGQSKLFHPEHLENYVAAYRYFKECRNALTHAGGIASERVVDAFDAFSTVTATDLDVKERPECFTPETGRPLRLSLRGVVGFAQILLRMVSTIDIELIKATHACTYFIDSVRHYNPVVTATSAAKRKSQVMTLIRRSSFASPVYSDSLYRLLRDYGVVR